jgi:hypothetical protein
MLQYNGEERLYYAVQRKRAFLDIGSTSNASDYRGPGLVGF